MDDNQNGNLRILQRRQYFEWRKWHPFDYLRWKQFTTAGRSLHSTGDGGGFHFGPIVSSTDLGHAVHWRCVNILLISTRLHPLISCPLFSFHCESGRFQEHYEQTEERSWGIGATFAWLTMECQRKGHFGFLQRYVSGRFARFSNLESIHRFDKSNIDLCQCNCRLLFRSLQNNTIRNSDFKRRTRNTLSFETKCLKIPFWFGKTKQILFTFWTEKRNQKHDFQKKKK